jgi:hypothetical protein
VLQAATMKETLEMGDENMLLALKWITGNGSKLFNDKQVRIGQNVALLEFLKSTDWSTGGDGDKWEK